MNTNACSAIGAPTMTKRGDTALFQGVAMGIGAAFLLAGLLAFVPGFPQTLGMVAGFAPHIGGAMAGALWAYRVWKRGEAADRKARRLCVKCGYDLTGNTSGRCPECGPSMR